MALSEVAAVSHQNLFLFPDENSSDDWEKLSSGEKSPRKASKK